MLLLSDAPALLPPPHAHHETSCCYCLPSALPCCYFLVLPHCFHHLTHTKNPAAIIVCLLHCHAAIVLGASIAPTTSSAPYVQLVLFSAFCIAMLLKSYTSALPLPPQPDQETRSYYCLPSPVPRYNFPRLQHCFHHNIRTKCLQLLYFYAFCTACATSFPPMQSCKPGSCLHQLLHAKCQIANLPHAFTSSVPANTHHPAPSKPLLAHQFLFLYVNLTSSRLFPSVPPRPS